MCERLKDRETVKKSVYSMKMEMNVFLIYS